MAWAHVQTNGNILPGTGNTITHTYGAAVAAGDLLCCLIICGTGFTINSVADSVNGAWTVAKFVDGGANPGCGAIYFFPSTAAGTPLVTVTFSGVVGTRRLICSEYSGIAPAAPFDVSAGQGQTNPGTGADAVKSGATAAIAQANSLVYGGTRCVVTTALAVGTGFTQRFNTVSGGAAVAVEDKISGAAGSTAEATFTGDNAGADPVTVVAVFKEPAASSTPRVLTMTGAG